MSLDEFEQIGARLERRLRDARVVEVLADVEPAHRHQGRFAERGKPEAVLAERLTARPSSKSRSSAKKSTRPGWWSITIRPMPSAHDRHRVCCRSPSTGACAPLAKQVADFNKPPFTVVKDGHRENIARLARAAGARQERRHARSQRPALQRSGRDERRAALVDHHERGNAHAAAGRSEDLAETEPIFSTLMGEDVESRRKFIEENALDVRNLDV